MVCTLSLTPLDGPRTHPAGRRGDVSASPERGHDRAISIQEPGGRRRPIDFAPLGRKPVIDDPATICPEQRVPAVRLPSVRSRKHTVRARRLREAVRRLQGCEVGGILRDRQAGSVPSGWRRGCHSHRPSSRSRLDELPQIKGVQVSSRAVDCVVTRGESRGGPAERLAPPAVQLHIRGRPAYGLPPRLGAAGDLRGRSRRA